ncbi:MAG: peptidylprolyl isomerase, partial [Elusimicrobiaceae bacterium]|nr:peptidylprolyl isomerase [Elusimicrobiaceae bacterium]
LKSYKAKLSKEIASRKLLEQELKKTIKPVEEADAKALYDDVQAVLKNNTKKIKEMEKADPQHLAEVQAIAAKLKQLSAEQVRLGHIYLATTKDMSAADVTKKAELAKKIKKELDAGMDFSTAVKNYTEDKQALATGGDMILIKGIAPKEIDAKAFTLPVGKVSDPIKTDVGYHIIKVKEKRAPRTISYDEIKNDLGQYIAQTRVLEAQANFLKELADKADIKVTKEFEVDKALAKEAQAKEEVKQPQAKQMK